MAEVDIKALKETREGMSYWTWPRITGEVLDDIIAALEDRERLRIAAQKIVDDVCHDPRIYSGDLVVFGRYVDTLRAELEGRDG